MSFDSKKFLFFYYYVLYFIFLFNNFLINNVFFILIGLFRGVRFLRIISNLIQYSRINSVYNIFLNNLNINAKLVSINLRNELSYLFRSNIAIIWFFFYFFMYLSPELIICICHLLRIYEVKVFFKCFFSICYLFVSFFLYFAFHF